MLSFLLFILFLPRQGTETCSVKHSYFPFLLFILFLPRQGTETSASQIRGIQFRTFILFLPRQGTETRAIDVAGEDIISQFILFLPRQGTETQQVVLFLKDYQIYFISSPSGDGNSLSRPYTVRHPPIYFISSPSGDGNCLCLVFRSAMRKGFILFLPRQGTVIDLLFLMSKINFYFFTFLRKGTG